MKLVIFIAWSLKDSQSLSLYTSSLFSISLNEDIVDVLQKPDGIGSLIFVADDFLGVFLQPSIFSIEDSITKL